MPEKTIPFRLYAQILIFSAFVALGALILTPIQRAIQGGMIGIRDVLITRLEDQINRKIRYSSISPSLFGSFDVRNVSIMGQDDHPVLTMSRFRVVYSLLGLLRGRAQAIQSVQIDNPLFDFNTTRDNDLIDLFENINRGDDISRQNAAAVFPEKLLVRIRNGKCLILNGRDQFELDTLNLNIEIADSRMILDGRWNVGVTIDKLIGEPVSLYVAMRVSGSCQTDMQEGEAVLSIPAITKDALSASPIAFGFVLEDSVLRVGKLPDSLPLDFSLSYEIEDGKIDAQMECTDFRLREFLSFSGGLEGARQLLDIAGSGTASFERRHDGSLSYSVDLAGTADAGSRSPQAVRASFEVAAAGDEQRAHINTLRLSLPTAEERSEGEDSFFFGDLKFSGSAGLNPFAPEGILSLGNFSLSGVDGLNADIAIHTQDNASGREISISCDTLRLGQVELGALGALLQPAENGLDFAVSARRRLDAGSLALDGRLDTSPRYTQARLRLNSFSAGDLAGMTLPFVKNASVPVPVKGLLNGTVITTEIFLTTNFKNMAYNAPRFVFTNGAGRGLSGVISLSGTDGRFELKDGRFSWGEDTVLVSGKAEFTDRQDMGFSVQTSYRDLKYSVEGAVVDGKSVTIQGAYGLDVRLTASGGGYTGYMRADGFPAPFLGYPAFCSFAAQMRYTNAASWSMNLERFELIDIASPAGPAQIRISGSADQNGVRFPLLYYRDAIGPLNGGADFSWTTDYSGFTGTVEMGDDAERYYVTSSFADERFNLIFSASSMRLDRAFGRVKARADGDLYLSWNAAASFRAALNIRSATGTLYDQKFGASVHAVLDSGELTVNDLNFSFAGIEGSMPRFVISGAQGTIQSEAAVQGIAGGRPIEGGLSLTAGFRPIRSWFEVNEIIRSFNGKLHVEALKYGIGGQPQTFDITFSRSDNVIAVSGGPRNMIRFRMDHDGSFYGGLSSPFPVRGTVVGSIRQGTIDATCGDLYVDLGELFNLLPENLKFYLTGGYINASVDVRGSLTAPEFFGSARATSVRIRIPDVIAQELRPIPFTIAIEGNEMNFGPVSTSVGAGAGTATGWFLFDRWIPNIFSIDITVPRETPVPYGLDISGFVARGNAAGNLNVSMENVTLDITGDVYVNNTEMGVNYEEVANAREGNPFAQVKVPFVLSLTVSTGPVVEFFYPSSRIPILRANPDMGTRLRVTVDSLAQQYSLLSDVRIRSGEIFYFERSFYIRSGILMLRENELRFDPRLTARAEIRDRTEDGPVTISMIVDNAPLRSFTARFESSPSLSQMEILSLLGQNIAGTQLNENTDAALRAISSSLSDLGAQFYVVRQLEQQIRNFTRLDMFSVRTQVFQNALFSAAGLMQPPVDRIAGVGNYFDNTTVFGGKYIGQDMFVQGMLSMRYEGERGLTFAPDIGLEMQNPLFRIRWDFVPTHPENWYVNDNSITLTRSWTF